MERRVVSALAIHLGIGWFMHDEKHGSTNLACDHTLFSHRQPRTNPPSKDHNSYDCSQDIRFYVNFSIIVQ